MNPFNFLKTYFNFNKRERNGIIVLLSFLVLILLARIYICTIPAEVKLKITYLDSLSTTVSRNDSINTSYARPSAGFTAPEASSNGEELFVFDPNKITEEQALRLGFSKKLAKTLTNFCGKGGKFRTKEDLKKLYGLPDKLYVKLLPYVLIEEQAASANKTPFTKKEFEKPAVRVLELNTADSAALVSLNGIGPSFARKIIKFRNALGGFCRKQQLLEVYGMKDTLYQRFEKNIYVDPGLVKKINPNTSTYEELKKHPYINHNIAGAIINYRSKHGPFKTEKELLQTGVISEELLVKLKNYLDFG